jgi:hypothetical protein
MTTKFLISTAAALIATAMLVPAQAEEINRTGPNGGTVTGSWTAGDQTATGSVSVVGPNGGTGSANFGCVQGDYRQGCAHAGTFTSANGNTWSGFGATGVGPNGGGHVGAATGPNGSRVVGRAWRR